MFFYYVFYYYVFYYVLLFFVRFIIEKRNEYNERKFENRLTVSSLKNKRANTNSLFSPY